MRSVSQYQAKADEFARLAAATKHDVLRRRYADLADCYRLLAHERQRMIDSGVIEPDTGS